MRKSNYIDTPKKILHYKMKLSEKKSLALIEGKRERHRTS